MSSPTRLKCRPLLDCSIQRAPESAATAVPLACSASRRASGSCPTAPARSAPIPRLALLLARCAWRNSWHEYSPTHHAEQSRRPPMPSVFMNHSRSGASKGFSLRRRAMTRWRTARCALIVWGVSNIRAYRWSKRPKYPATFGRCKSAHALRRPALRPLATYPANEAAAWTLYPTRLSRGDEAHESE